MPEEGLATFATAAARLIWYVGAMGVIGASAFRFVAARTSAERASPLTHAGARIGSLAALLLVCGVAARLLSQTYIVFGIEEPITPALVWLTATDLPPWSTGWLFQAGAALAAALVFRVVRSGRTGAWPVAHLAAAGVALTMPLTGHAVAQPQAYALPVALQTGHVVGAGVWLGGLVMLLAATHDDGRPGAPVVPDVPALVGRFSLSALAGAGVVVASGIATTVVYLPSFGDLTGTPYGRALLLKLAFFAAVAALGFVNWRIVRPRLARPGGLARLRRMAKIELTFAGLVLAATAVLTGLAQPAE